MSSLKSYVAESSTTRLFLYPCIFSQRLHFFQCFTLATYVHAAGKRFPGALHVGSTLHFQMEMRQNNVESHGRENLP